MSKYKMVHHNGMELYEVGILPDGTLYNPNGYPEDDVRSAVLATDADARKWLASRKEAGRLINIETCEIRGWYANANGDPYGIRRGLGEEDHLEEGYVDKFNFVSSPDSDGWVCESDLPTEKVRAMYARIHREAEADRRHLDEAFGVIRPLLEANPSWKYRDALEHLHASGAELSRRNNPYLQIEYLNRHPYEAVRLEAKTAVYRMPA